MYSNLKSCVKSSSGGETTDYFPCNVGTRQCDISSPVIVSLFINDLCTMLHQQYGGGIFIHNTINLIFYVCYLLMMLLIVPRL